MRKKHFYKKEIICFVWLFLLFLAVDLKAVRGEETGSVSTVTTDTYNIILLIDKSGSMNDTDEKKWP